MCGMRLWDLNCVSLTLDAWELAAPVNLIEGKIIPNKKNEDNKKSQEQNLIEKYTFTCQLSNTLLESLLYISEPNRSKCV